MSDLIRLWNKIKTIPEVLVTNLCLKESSEAAQFKHYEDKRLADLLGYCTISRQNGLSDFLGHVRILRQKMAFRKSLEMSMGVAF